jgi:hypothetical protein
VEAAAGAVTDDPATAEAKKKSDEAGEGQAQAAAEEQGRQELQGNMKKRASYSEAHPHRAAARAPARLRQPWRPAPAKPAERRLRRN